MKAYAITSLPQDIDKRMLVEAMLQKQFAMYHDLLMKRTFLIACDETGALLGAVPGLGMVESAPNAEASAASCLVTAGPNDDSDVIGSTYQLFGGIEAGVLVVFTPIGGDEVASAKIKTERLLSAKETGSTESTSTRGDAMSQTASLHKDLYRDSEETDFLTTTLEMLKSAALANGNAYKIVVFLTGDHAKVEEYLASKLTVFESRKVGPQSLKALCEIAKRTPAMPFSSSGASRMVGFSNTVRTRSTIGAAIPQSAGEISIGLVTEGSVRETATHAYTDSCSLNLGTVISGVPGTGKTFAAMHILGQLAQRKGTMIAVIAPTVEWNAFGYENKLRVVRLGSPETRFNFFKCDSGIVIGRFYENLAMLLASASEAGPYTSSLEKCMLSAFRKVYASDRKPDPVDVYDAIEEAIIEQHGKRTVMGVKYTKHGENSRSALENLRAMLNKPEFSKREGEDFAELLEAGVVFDLSEVSNKMKRFYYALILNQIYSFADQLDTEGDKELRMLVCMEEAQVVFEPENDSAATSDLKRRIQDFRKKGVGLMLITHNVTDIDAGIRRLCQTKLYFRQSADVAKFAANDLLFSEAEKDALVERLKGLEQRVCAFNYLQGRELACSGFTTIPRHESGYIREGGEAASDNDPALTGMTIKIVDREGTPRKGARMYVFYVGEKIHEGVTDERGSMAVAKTIRGNSYRLVVLGEKRKDSKTFRIVGGEVNIVEI